jgi:hypothetical protein
VHTAALLGSTVSVTVRPELAVADTGAGSPSTIPEAGAVIVIDWVCRLTVIVCWAWAGA